MRRDQPQAVFLVGHSGSFDVSNVTFVEQKESDEIKCLTRRVDVSRGSTYWKPTNSLIHLYNYIKRPRHFVSTDPDFPSSSGYLLEFLTPPHRASSQSRPTAPHNHGISGDYCCTLLPPKRCSSALLKQHSAHSPRTAFRTHPYLPERHRIFDHPPRAHQFPPTSPSQPWPPQNDTA